MSHFVYAGFWLRVVAWAIDFVVAQVFVKLLTLVFFGLMIFDPSALLFELLFPWVYFAGFESSKLQATPGKMALGLVVVDNEGRRLNLFQALLRFGGKFISSGLFFVGFLMVALTKEKKGLHDFIAGTLVLKAADLFIGVGQVEEEEPITEVRPAQNAGFDMTELLASEPDLETASPAETKSEDTEVVTEHQKEKLEQEIAKEIDPDSSYRPKEDVATTPVAEKTIEPKSTVIIEAEQPKGRLELPEEDPDARYRPDSLANPDRPQNKKS